MVKQKSSKDKSHPMTCLGRHGGRGWRRGRRCNSFDTRR